MKFHQNSPQFFISLNFNEISVNFSEISLTIFSRVSFLWEKVKKVDFSETIAASYLKDSRSSHLIECMKVCEY